MVNIPAGRRFLQSHNIAIPQIRIALHVIAASCRIFIDHSCDTLDGHWHLCDAPCWHVPAGSWRNSLRRHSVGIVVEQQRFCCFKLYTQWCFKKRTCLDQSITSNGKLHGGFCCLFPHDAFILKDEARQLITTEILRIQLQKIIIDLFIDVFPHHCHRIQNVVRRKSNGLLITVVDLIQHLSQEFGCRFLIIGHSSHSPPHCHHSSTLL